MPITKPQLQPKKGYVEVEENGVRVYKKIDIEEEQIRADIDFCLAMLGVTE